MCPVAAVASVAPGKEGKGKDVAPGEAGKRKGKGKGGKDGKAKGGEDDDARGTLTDWEHLGQHGGAPGAVILYRAADKIANGWDYKRQVGKLVIDALKHAAENDVDEDPKIEAGEVLQFWSCESCHFWRERVGPSSTVGDVPIVATGTSCICSSCVYSTPHRSIPPCILHPLTRSPLFRLSII